MGVIGLTSFINSNNHLLNRHELRDSQVVLDGNNLIHYFYRACNMTFGGDYDVYREELLQKFTSMLKCGIRPYVVFDGGYSTDRRKHKTCLDRARKRISAAASAPRTGRCHSTPVLAYDTFLQTLNELGIPHVTCQFEADNEMAKLANELECPVISNDSDFYILDLRYGFLPLDSVDFNPLYKDDDGSNSSSSYYFLYCKKYHVDGLIASVEELNRSVLPMFATLLGNDYISESSAIQIYDRLKRKVSKVSNSKKGIVPSRIREVLGLIHWFLQRCDPSDIVEEMLPYVDCKEEFLLSVMSYCNIIAFDGCHLAQFFSDSDRNFQPKAGPTFLGYNSTPFPDWFLSSVCRGEITPFILNAAVLRCVIFLCQVEDVTVATAYQCGEYLRRVLYGILIQSDLPCKTNPSLNTNKSVAVGDYSGLLAKTKLMKADYEKMFVRVEKDFYGDSERAEENIDIDTDTNLTSDNCHHTDVSHSTNETVCERKTNSKGEAEKDSLKQMQIEEHQRSFSSLKKVNVVPLLYVCGDKLPSLSEIGVMKKRDRLSILLKVFDSYSSSLEHVAPDLHLFTLCLCMWIDTADPCVTQHHLDCVIVCSILLHMKHVGLSCGKMSHGQQSNKCVQQETPTTVIDFKKICNNCKSSPQFAAILNNLSKYHSSVPVFGRGNSFNPKVTHAFSQLQCCLYEASNLNKLLRFPLPCPNPALLMNGTFLYNFYCDIVDISEPSLFIEEMLVKGSDLHGLFHQFKFVILNSVPNSFNSMKKGDNVGGSKRKRIKKRKKNSETPYKNKSKVSDESQQIVSEEEMEVTTVGGFDVRNKYSLLLMTE